ncbi:hypothetical protein ACEYW6_06300 [Nostoc sp. UIC 10607]|uniref:hypothetical protein n=1 Tax=Nostoc sp. UIC 10607 TaxID=3045935 RepID=UPI0039A3ADAA
MVLFQKIWVNLRKYLNFNPAWVVIERDHSILIKYEAKALQSVRLRHYQDHQEAF